MESLYTADVTLTYEDFKAFSFHHETRKGDKVRPSVMFLFAIAAMLVVALISDVIKRFNWYDIVYVLLILFLPVGRFLVLSTRAKRDFRDYEEGHGHSRYDFTAEGVVREKTDAFGTSAKEYKYDDYLRIVKTKKAFYLYVTEDEVHIVPVGSLAGSEPMDLARFLDKKMGAAFSILN